MSLRVCLVTPFALSQPHDVNEHVAGAAEALRLLGHSVTVLAPSSRAGDLLAGRRALLEDSEAEVIALGPSFPISRRSSMGVPVGVRANLALALAGGRYDIVHGFEPGLPSLSYLALRDTEAFAVATFLSPDRLAYPAVRSRRERLLARTDALLATSSEVAAAAAERFPGEYHVVPLGVDPELFAPEPKRQRIVLEWRPNERVLARAVLRMLRELPAWELVLLRTKPLMGRPAVPAALRDRVTVRTARDGAARARLLKDASIFVPGIEGMDRLRLEAQAAGVAIASPPNLEEQPQLAAAALARLAEDGALRERLGDEGLAKAERESFAALAAKLDTLYAGVGSRRRGRRHADLLEGRERILCDLHMHTSWSHDCGTEVADLVAHAEAIGLGAIAITDHNAFGGSLEAMALAEGRNLTVIPGEEVKTDDGSEVIGLFLREEIPRGLSFGDTIAAIHAQGGLVYLPHPFDRLHAIPDPATLHRHLADIDVFEVWNGKLVFETYNDEALRFARKYNLTAGAGSDAHVLPGVGTGAVRMRAFRDAEEFLISLRSAEIVRRPRSIAYLQGLKWVAQVKERVR